MSYTVNLQQRIQQLKKAQADLGTVFHDVQKRATQRAVEAAAAATPPKEGTGRGPYIGANTVAGELKQNWAVASTVEPINSGGTYTTYLANNLEYASYVNDGHRMDRHFVPGLYIDASSGLMEYDPNQEGGMMVGTKTKFVKGEFMTDRAKEAYEKTVLAEMDRAVGEMLK